jgi:hypothetical protein
MDEFWAKAGVFTSKVTYLYYINIMPAEVDLVVLAVPVENFDFTPWWNYV